MICTVMQPTYMPWIGYFELMDKSDVFVLFDDVQFVKKSWHHRNKIKSNGSELLLSISVITKGKRGQLINEVVINNNDNWKQKHLKTIELNYGKSTYFSDYYPKLKDIYEKEYETLLSFTKEIIYFLRDSFGIKTKILCSSELDTKGRNEFKVAEICKKLNCTTLYNTAGAESFFDVKVLNEVNIDVIFQKYTHPEYHQLGADFLPFMSAIDLLFNEGGNSLKVIKSGNLIF